MLINIRSKAETSRQLARAAVAWIILTLCLLSQTPGWSGESQPGATEVPIRFKDLSNGWPRAHPIPEVELAKPAFIPPIEERNRLQVLGYLSEFQDRVFEDYRTNTNGIVKLEDAWILRELWQQGFLSRKIKNELIDRYFHAELYQFAAPYPAFAVFADLSFPFPSNWTGFEPTLYVNGKSVAVNANSSHGMNLHQATLANHGGGEYRNGDIIQFEIKISQQDFPGEKWERVIKSNPIRLDKLRPR